MRDSSPRRSVIGRGLSLLEAFSVARPQLTLGELSRRSGVPTSSASRLVADLLAWGALERGADGRLRIGLRVWEVGTLARRGYTLRDAALPSMEDLSAVVGGHVQLTIHDAGQVVYMEVLPDPGTVQIASRVGGRLPLHATGSGQVFLAAMTPPELEHALQQPLRRYTRHTVTDPDRLRRLVAEVRRSGVAVVREAVGPGVTSVAVPVRDPTGPVTASLSVVVDVAVDVRPLVPALRAAALGVTRRLVAPVQPLAGY